MKAIALIAAVLLAFSPALADESATRLTDIQWSSKPTGEDMASNYPNRAEAEERGGWALLSCRIAEDRRPTNCKIADEAPEGYGFGAAALKIADDFRLQKPKNGQAVVGRRVLIPIVWHLEGDTAPKSYPAGEPSMLVTIAPAGTDKRRTFACPSKADPERACMARHFTWTTRPELEELSGLIRKSIDGASAMECSVSSSGALENCKIADSGAATTEAELLALVGRFQAPPQTDDGTPTAGQRVILTFDWKILRKILEVLEAT